MSKSRIVFLAVICILSFTFIAGCGNGSKGASQTNTAQPVTTEVNNAKAAGVDVTVEQALSMWQNKQAVIIDVRTQAEYQEGHIPGVANIPLDQLESRMNEIPKDQKVLIICRSGKRSGQGTNLLRGKGFDNVFNVAEGMLGWKGPVEK